MAALARSAVAVVGIAAGDTDFMVVANLLVVAFTVDKQATITLKPDITRVVIEASVEMKA